MSALGPVEPARREQWRCGCGLLVLDGEQHLCATLRQTLALESIAASLLRLVPKWDIVPYAPAGKP